MEIACFSISVHFIKIMNSKEERGGVNLNKNMEITGFSISVQLIKVLNSKGKKGGG